MQKNSPKNAVIRNNRFLCKKAAISITTYPVNPYSAVGKPKTVETEPEIIGVQLTSVFMSHNAVVAEPVNRSQSTYTASRIPIRARIFPYLQRETLDFLTINSV